MIGRSDDATISLIFPERGLFVRPFDHLQRAGGADVTQRKSGLQNRRGTSGRDLGADGFGTAARTRIIDRLFPKAA